MESPSPLAAAIDRARGIVQELSPHSLDEFERVVRQIEQKGYLSRNEWAQLEGIEPMTSRELYPLIDARL